MVVLSGKIELSSKSGFPLIEQQARVETDEESVVDNVCVHQQRSRDEAPEEKKSRKKAVKQAQKEARVLKKETKTRYRQAMIQQQKQSAAMLTKNASVIQL